MLEDYRWLVSDAAEPWLARVRAEVTASGGASASLLSRLRKELSADRAHLVVKQALLRERAREKFALAERMFFTRKGLEQATDEQVAAAKAARFSSDQPVADLCCGIGGDLLALAQAREARNASEGVVGVERDASTAILAAANLRAGGCTSAAIRLTDAATFPVGDFAAWHIDPDRRPTGKRTTRVELYEPSADALDSRLAANCNAAIKLAPATQVPQHWAPRAEFQWLGSRGECRQQVAWFGSLARHSGQHSATAVDARGGQRTIVGSPNEPVPTAQRLGRFLFEPHAAILAAKLTGVICRERSLAAVSPGVAYLTAAPGDRETLPGNDLPAGKTISGKDSRHLGVAILEPALDAFEVLDLLPLDVRRLKAWCRERRIGRLVIKKRGVAVDPNKLWKAIVGQGDEEALLIVTPIGGHVRVVFVRRVSPPPSADPAA